MSYQNAKIYTDGSHYIAIPHESHPERKQKNKSKKDYDKKEAFERAYNEVKAKKKAEKGESIVENIKGYFKSEREAREYVEHNIERKKRNTIAKRVRLWRKVNLQEWQYFATFTYDDKKHSEDTFRKALSNSLRHLSSRKAWKYIGVWERSPEKERLHFHCMIYIPKGNEMGELIEKNDYDTTSHRRQITYQNTYFNERFGRTDFKTICKQDVGSTVSYLIKYLEKTNERIIYSRNLPQYFISDILSDDVICGYGHNDRKLILTDEFRCFNEGEYIGNVSHEVIAKMPKSN